MMTRDKPNKVFGSKIGGGGGGGGGKGAQREHLKRLL